jgi:hypothetical protein
MATLVTRAGKGSPLTNNEVDANFNNLNSDKVETSAISTFGGSLVDDADASTARTTLGLASLATADTVNNGQWSGTDLTVANGGTGASSASAARTNLDVDQAGTALALAIALG